MGTEGAVRSRWRRSSCGYCAHLNSQHEAPVATAGSSAKFISGSGYHDHAGSDHYHGSNYATHDHADPDDHGGANHYHDYANFDRHNHATYSVAHHHPDDCPAC